MKRFLSSLAALAALSYAAPALAQVPGQNVQVNARVNTACTVDTGAGADVVLSTILTDTGNIPATNTGVVSVRCTRGTKVSVKAGTVDGGSFGRNATCTTAASCGAETIAYSLYVSSAGWTGPAISTLLSTTDVALGESQNKGTALSINYQAQFPAAADPKAGDYLGTVAVTYTVAP